MSKHRDPIGVTAETFDLMSWISSGTIARRQVTIYNDHEAAALLADLDAEIALHDTSPATADGPLSGAAESPTLAALLERREQLVDRIADSGAIWTVRALSQDDIDDSFDPDKGGVADPKRPVPPLEAGQKAQDRFNREVATYQRRLAEANRSRRLVQLATAVEKVETTRGTSEGASVEVLHALLSRPHGAQMIDRLWAAVNAATEEDVAAPRPSSREGSTSTRA